MASGLSVLHTENRMYAHESAEEEQGEAEEEEEERES